MEMPKMDIVGTLGSMFTPSKETATALGWAVYDLIQE
jgi:hypothetical protein